MQGAGRELAGNRHGGGREQAWCRQAGGSGCRGQGQREAGSYLLQGEGGAVAALLPSQESVVEVAGGVTSEGGRACGPRAALGAAVPWGQKAGAEAARAGSAAPSPRGPGAAAGTAGFCRPELTPARERAFFGLFVL